LPNACWSSSSRTSSHVPRLRLRLNRRGEASPKKPPPGSKGPEGQSLSARQGGRAARDNETNCRNPKTGGPRCPTRDDCDAIVKRLRHASLLFTGSPDHPTSRFYLPSCRLWRRNSSTFGIASSEDCASPSTLPPKFCSLPEVGLTTLPCQTGTISGRPARCPA